MKISATYRPNKSLLLGPINGSCEHTGTFCEQYVGRQRLAEIMGVSARTIDRFVVLGMPSTTWGIRARRFLPSQAIAWAERHAEVTR